MDRTEIRAASDSNERITTFRTNGRFGAKCLQENQRFVSDGDICVINLSERSGGCTHVVVGDS